MFLLSLCVLPDLQYHLFRNSEALMHNDSRTDLRRFCRIPRNCQYKWPSARQILHHNGTTVIVSIITILAENCTICCYEVTKLFSSSYLVSGALSAKSPCHVGPFAYFAISVLRKVRENAVLSRYQAACLMPRFVQRLSSSTKSCANSSSHSSRSRKGSLRAHPLSPFFYVCFWFPTDLATGLPALGSVYAHFVCLLDLAKNHLVLGPVMPT